MAAVLGTRSDDEAFRRQNVATGLPAHVLYGAVNDATISLREAQCLSDIRAM